MSRVASLDKAGAFLLTKRDRITDCEHCPASMFFVCNLLRLIVCALSAVSLMGFEAWMRRGDGGENAVA